MKKKAKYDTTLPSRMYTFFLGYEGAGAPSFSKFARSIRVTLSELESFRKHKKFDEAYRECGEIRRDYLIDAGLTRRCDPSLVKYLLAEEFGNDGEAAGGRIDLTLEFRYILAQFKKYLIQNFTFTFKGFPSSISVL